LRGVTIHVITGDTYKDNSGADVTMSAPGKGSTSYNTWTTIKTKHMMRTNSYEDALLTASKLGITWRPSVYNMDPYPAGNIVPVSWMDNNPKMFYTYLMTRYGFAVEDFAKVHTLSKVASVLVS
jgi:hypothetical protein